MHTRRLQAITRLSQLMDHAGPTVLLVEPDGPVMDATRASLQRAGFRVDTAIDGLQAKQRVLHGHLDLVIVEETLPDISGVELCRWIRTKSTVVVILASNRRSEADTVAGLEAGADDYVTKPYRLAELVARARAAMRRTDRAPSPTAGPAEGPVLVADVVLDRAGHTVLVRGTPVGLPLREFQLLSALLAARGQIVTRKELMQRLWGSSPVNSSKSLDVHIQRLRRRIEVEPARPARILTVRGVGYLFKVED